MRKVIDPKTHRPAPSTVKAAPGPDDTFEDEPEIDVWPTADVLEEEERLSPVEESGLSVDPEDLGRQWLNQATEQNNFESSEPEESSGIHVISVPVKSPF